MSDALSKKLILISLLLFAAGFIVAGATIIILKLNSRPLATDYLGAGSMVVMGLFLAVLSYVLVKKKILD